MGFILDVDLETSSGPTHEMYVRIESIIVNRVTSKARFQLTYWVDYDHALSTNRTYIEEELRSLQGLVQERILYYENEDSDGNEILLPNLLDEDLAEETEVEIPVFENRDISKEVPYTSFDENGDEVTLYRTVTSLERVKVGTKLEKRRVINVELASNIFEFGYSRVKKMLENYFPADKIKNK